MCLRGRHIPVGVATRRVGADPEWLSLPTHRTQLDALGLRNSTLVVLHAGRSSAEGLERLLWVGRVRVAPHKVPRNPPASQITDGSWASVEGAYRVPQPRERGRHPGARVPVAGPWAREALFLPRSCFTPVAPCCEAKCSPASPVQ